MSYNHKPGRASRGPDPNARTSVRRWPAVESPKPASGNPEDKLANEIRKLWLQERWQPASAVVKP